MAAIMGEEVIETGDFVVNEKDKIVNLTEQGVHKVEKFFHIENLADPENLEIQHNITLALRAHNLMHKDQDYVVKDDEILIVDEFTGRIRQSKRKSMLRSNVRARLWQPSLSRTSLINMIRRAV